MNKTKVLHACYTISKYSLMSPVLMHLHKPYAATIGSGIHFVWFLMIVIGASSAYFHATLSLFGQLLDEIAILWIIMSCYALWYPTNLMPGSLIDKEGRRTFKITVSYYSRLRNKHSTLLFYHIEP